MDPQNEILRLKRLPTKDLGVALGSIADYSRDPAQREAIGLSGLLEYCLEVLARPEQASIHMQALRVIANSCADTDCNRDRVIATPFIQAIFDKLSSQETAEMALITLHNISLDHERAQTRLREKGLCKVLIRFLCNCSPTIHLHRYLGYACTLLSFSFEDYNVEESPTTAVTTFLRLCGTVSEYSELVCLNEIFALHLRHISFQRFVVENSQFESLLSTISRLAFFPMNHDLTIESNRFHVLEGSQKGDNILESNRLHEFEGQMSGNPACAPPSDRFFKDDLDQLEVLLDLFSSILQDISSLPDFTSKYPYESGITSTMISWLNCQRLQAAACMVLSNLARANADWALSMVSRSADLHMGSTRMLHQAATKRKSLYAALDLLLQLARPIESRATICTEAFLSAVAQFWRADDPQIQYAMTTVLRELLRDSPSAVRRLLSPSNSECNESYVSLMLKLYVTSSDAKVKLEIQKIVIEICRCLPHLEPAERTTFLTCTKFTSPIKDVITQVVDPALRAGGYLALVLIVHEEAGLVHVDEIVRRRNVFEHLVQGITGERAGSVLQPSAPENMSIEQWKIVLQPVRDNAMWLLKDMLQSSMEETNHNVTLSRDWAKILDNLFNGTFGDPEQVLTMSTPFLAP